VKEINALRSKFNETLGLFNAQEKELQEKNYSADKSGIAEIARAQIKIASQGADLLREVAVKAERVSKVKLKGNYSQYFSLIAQSSGKRMEALAAIRERAEVLLSNEPSETIMSKINEATAKVDKLNKEADELEERAAQIMTGRND
jgi:hypothetical protein